MVDSGKTSDAKAMDVVNGKGDMVDVVTAISQTELAMETMVTVRDRVISAYEEIMRMPI
ncbi:flagellar hook-basal body complex protein FliE [Devosia sp.]|uniref:flagellar hook-basal body complex protein FliE n=1 Tax=Devosia sp. TaxID=1871048 RepID=UPI003BAB3AA0